VLENHTYAHRANSLLELVGRCVKSARPVPDAYFSVFIALRMVEGAIQAAKAAFDWRESGRAQRFVAGMARAGLSLLILAVKAVERARNLVRVVR
jgi:hypothetical protein